MNKQKFVRGTLVVIFLATFVEWFFLSTPSPKFGGQIFQLPKHGYLMVEDVKIVFDDNNDLMPSPNGACAQEFGVPSWLEEEDYDYEPFWYYVKCKVKGVIYKGEKWGIYTHHYHWRVYVEVFDMTKPQPLLTPRPTSTTVPTPTPIAIFGN